VELADAAPAAVSVLPHHQGLLPLRLLLLGKPPRSTSKPGGPLLAVEKTRVGSASSSISLASRASRSTSPLDPQRRRRRHDRASATRHRDLAAPPRRCDLTTDLRPRRRSEAIRPHQRRHPRRPDHPGGGAPDGRTAGDKIPVSDSQDDRSPSQVCCVLESLVVSFVY
jgi:hypothetical protein